MTTPKSSKLSCSAKYGFHQGKFAQLPTLEDYIVLKPNAWVIDIEPELTMLKENKHSQLCITVPCLGFSDPAFDYSLYPWFATPLSIAGLIATDNQCLSRAKVIGTDINGVQYPLLMDHFGKIDYEKIESQLDNTPIVTSLKAISFIYTDAQILNGQGLMPLPNRSEKLELMLARALPSFNITLTVFHQKQIILGKRECHYQTKHQAPKTFLNVGYQNEGENQALKIQYQTRIKAHDFAHTRARLEIQVPMQDGMIYRYGEHCQAGRGEALIINHYFGIGSLAKAILTESLIPKTHFIDKILEKAHFSKKKLHVNAFAENAWHASQLYYELLKGLMNGSVPLCSLNEYFVDETTLKHHVQSISLGALDRQDKFILQTLKDQLKKPHSKAGFVDALDKLLCLDPLKIDIEALLQLQGQKLSAHGDITAVLVVENEQDIRQYTNTAKVQNLQEGTSYIEYKITLGQIAQGEKIIEDFDYAKNHKINLSELLKALHQDTNHSTVIHAKTTTQGDTQIWVEHRTGGAKQQFHVATLKGVSAAKGNLSQDLGAYIVGFK